MAWVPFNEGWGEYDPARIADDVKAYDPSRLVSTTWRLNCCGFDGGNGDFIDDHVYVGPEIITPSGTRAAALGEYGGLGSCAKSPMESRRELQLREPGEARRCC